MATRKLSKKQTKRIDIRLSFYVPVTEEIYTGPSDFEDIILGQFNDPTNIDVNISMYPDRDFNSNF